jgi:hypothetical protein
MKMWAYETEFNTEIKNDADDNYKNPKKPLSDLMAGFLTVVDNALISIKNNGEIETIFKFPYEVHVEQVDIVGKCVVICAKRKGNQSTADTNKVLFCLYANCRVKTVDFTKVKSETTPTEISINNIKFFENFSIVEFPLTTKYYIFGSSVAFTSSVEYCLFVLALEPNQTMQIGLPTVITRSNDTKKISSTRLSTILLYDLLDDVIVDNDRFIIKQGVCIFAIKCNFTSNLYQDKSYANKKIVSAKMSGSNIQHLCLSEETADGIQYKFDDLSDMDTEMSETTNYALNMPSGIYLLIKPKENNLVCNAQQKHSFVVPIGTKFVDCLHIKTKDKLIVLVSNNNEVHYEPSFSLQDNVLVAFSDKWCHNQISFYNDGIVVMCDSGWYFLSVEKQIKIVHNIDSFYLSDCVSTGNNIILKHEFANKNCGPTQMPILTAGCIDAIKQEWVMCNHLSETKKYLVETFNGFVCFNGNNFVRLHEKISLALKNLDPSYYLKLDLDELVANANNYEYEDIIRGITLLVIEELNRYYLHSDLPSDSVQILFKEGESVLDTALLAHKVHRYVSTLEFALIGSQGSGPTRIVCSAIAEEFINRYFKLDGFFLVPNKKFIHESPETKFDLGWLLHNILYSTHLPIIRHLPLSLLCALTGKTAHISELKYYAKLADEDMFNMLSSATIEDLKEAGYENKFDWLAMMCRYSVSDIKLYQPLADGFRSFAYDDPFEKTNLISMDNFISGTYAINVSDLVQKLSDLSEHKHEKFATKLVDKLLNSNNSELKIFAKNLTGTFHLSGDEQICFSDLPKDVFYKFAVCGFTLHISNSIEEIHYDMIISEIFSPQQAKIVN